MWFGLKSTYYPVLLPLNYKYSWINYKLVGSIAQWLASLIPDPAAQGLIASIPKILSEEKIIHVEEVNQQSWLHKSGRWL